MEIIPPLDVSKKVRRQSLSDEPEPTYLLSHEPGDLRGETCSQLTSQVSFSDFGSNSVRHCGMRRREVQEVQQSQHILKANNAFQGRITDIFLQFDEDCSGTIDRKELDVVLKSMGYDLTPAQLTLVLEQVDVDGNGTLDLEEFTTFINLWRDAAGYKIFEHGQTTAAQHIHDSASTRTDLLIPDVPWRWVWDTVYMAVGVYFFLTVLLVHTFEDQDQLDAVQLGLIAPDVLGTIFLIVEMGMKVNMVVKDIDGPLHLDRDAILRKYVLSPYFFLDVVTMLPMRFFSSDPLASNVLNHFRLLLVLRFHTLWPTSGLVTITSNYVRYMYGLLPYIKGAFAFVCSVLLLTVLHQQEVRHSIHLGLVGKEEGTFAACLYWTLYVLAGVGNGDMSPKTEEHRWYAAFLFMVSMIINGLFVGSMVSVMQEADVENSRRSSLVLMQAVLRFFHVPPSLQEEILQFQNHILQRDIATSYAGIVDMLPQQMRHNILMQANVPLLQGVHTFRSAHLSTIVQLAEQLTSIFASPEVYIAVAGEQCQDLVLLNYGFIDVLTPTIGRYVTTLKRGEYFGELGVLDKESLVLHKYSFKALTYCDLFLLPLGRLVFLEEKFPKFSKDLRAELDLVKGKPDRFDQIVADSQVSTSRSSDETEEERLVALSGSTGLLAQRKGTRGSLTHVEDFDSADDQGTSNFYGGGGESGGITIVTIDSPGSGSEMQKHMPGVVPDQLQPATRTRRRSSTLLSQASVDGLTSDPELDAVVRDLEVEIGKERDIVSDLEARLSAILEFKEEELGIKRHPPRRAGSSRTVSPAVSPRTPQQPGAHIMKSSSSNNYGEVEDEVDMALSMGSSKVGTHSGPLLALGHGGSSGKYLQSPSTSYVSPSKAERGGASTGGSSGVASTPLGGSLSASPWGRLDQSNHQDLDEGTSNPALSVRRPSTGSVFSPADFQ